MNAKVQTWGGTRPPVHKTAAAALRRAGAVEGLRRDVLDRADLEAGGLEGTDRGLTAGAGTLDEDIDLLHAVLLGATSRRLGRELRGEGGGLTRTLEANLAGGCPGDNRARGVREGNDGVVERRLDVGVAVGDVLRNLATRLAGTARARGLCCCHFWFSSFLSRKATPRGWASLGLTWPSSCLQRCAWGPCGYARWSWCADRGPAGHDGGEGPGTNRFRSCDECRPEPHGGGHPQP